LTADSKSRFGDRKSLSVLVALTVIGGFLRFYKLGYHSLWSDELTVWQVTQIRSFTEMLKFHLSTDLNVPAYWIIQWLFVPFLKQDEWGVRFPVALAGVLSIPAMYFFARRAFSERVALIATGMFAVSHQAIYMSQEARAYSFLILFSILSTWFWLDLSRNRRAAAYLLCAAMLSYLHYFGLILVFVQGIVFLSMDPKRNWKRFLAVYGLAVLAFAPWLPLMAKHLQPISVWMKRPEWIDWAQYSKWIFDHSSVASLIAWLLILPMLWRSENRKIFRALAAIAMGPIAIAFIRSRMATPMLADRYLSFAVPVMILLVAAAIVETGSRIGVVRGVKASRVFVGIFASVFILASLNTTFVSVRYYDAVVKDQNREAALLADSLREKYSADLIVLFKNEAIGAYYYDLQGLKRPEFLLRADDKEIAETIARSAKASKGDYVVYYRQSPNVSDPFVKNHFDVVEEIPIYRAARVFVLKKLKN
jgi:mannosyltransferase